MTPIPCAHPADIVVLDAVDDLRIMPAYAYEKLVVLSVDPGQPSASASYMSGGDHDGDAVLLIREPRSMMLLPR